MFTDHRVVQKMRSLSGIDFIQHILQEMNRYEQQYQNSRDNLFSFHLPLRSWCPDTDNEVYAVLGLFTLTRTIQKPATRLHSSKQIILQTPGFSGVITKRDLNLSADLYISVTMTANQSTQTLQNFSRFSLFCLT
jgi:hypothetical protein